MNTSLNHGSPRSTNSLSEAVRPSGGAALRKPGRPPISAHRASAKRPSAGSWYHEAAIQESNTKPVRES